MPSITNKAFDALLISIDHFVNGLRKHSSNYKIVSIVKESELHHSKQELEALRLNYLEKESQARQAYNAFEIKFKAAQKETSNRVRILKGILDPKAEELLDFGIMPEKSKASKARTNLN